MANFFDSNVGSAVLGVGSNIVGSLFGGLLQKNNQKAQNQWAEKMMQQQHQWNVDAATTAYQRQVDFYNMQNDYNSPTNQIARLRAAGINPNLAYANGSLNNVSASVPSVAQSESASASAPSASDIQGSFSTLGSDFVRMYQMSEQNKTLKAQADKIQKEGQKLDFDNRIRAMTWLDEAHSLSHSYQAKSTLEDLAREQLEQARQASKQAQLQTEYMSSTQSDRISLLSAQKNSQYIMNSLNQCALKLEQAKVPYAEKMAYLSYRQAVQNIVLMTTQGILNRAQANAAYSDAVLKLAMAASEPHKRDMYDSQTDLNDAQRLDAYQLGTLHYQQSRRLGLETDFRYPKTFSGILFNSDGSMNVQGVKDTGFKFLDQAQKAAQTGVSAFAAGMW